MKVAVADIVWRDDLYPRIEPDPATIQRYAADLTVLPPIEVNQHNELIDGYHRWTAHRKENAAEIEAVVTETTSDVELLALACKRNSAHGLQLADKDKRSMAIRLYASGTGMEKAEIAETLSVSPRTVNGYLAYTDKQLLERRRETIRDMWLACYTQQEIADAVGVDKATASRELEDCCNLEALPKSNKLSALHEDADWTPPLYDIWNVSSNNNSTTHFGNTPVEFVDNLLYFYTKPFDIVVDPFAGGGSTIDVCKKRSRRYWVSDRLPIVERTDIRQHELSPDNISGPARWGDVALVYLDPPYWKQAAGKYSDDPTDLANMPLDEFTATLTGIVNAYAKKLHAGAHIACIISPTQWPNEDKSTVYHDIDLAQSVKPKLVQRILCPYSTQQYNGTQVDIAKERKLLLALTRTMLVWEVE